MDGNEVKLIIDNENMLKIMIFPEQQQQLDQP